MQGIQLVTDVRGRIQEIRVDVKNNPTFAEEVVRMVKALRRAQATERAQQYKEAVQKMRRRKSLSPKAFLDLIDRARNSGEISEEEFFQTHPQWRRDAESS